MTLGCRRCKSECSCASYAQPSPETRAETRAPPAPISPLLISGDCSRALNCSTFEVSEQLSIAWLHPKARTVPARPAHQCDFSTVATGSETGVCGTKQLSEFSDTPTRLAAADEYILWHPCLCISAGSAGCSGDTTRSRGSFLVCQTALHAAGDTPPLIPPTSGRDEVRIQRPVQGQEA